MEKRCRNPVVLKYCRSSSIAFPQIRIVFRAMEAVYRKCKNLKKQPAVFLYCCTKSFRIVGAVQFSEPGRSRRIALNISRPLARWHDRPGRTEKQPGSVKLMEFAAGSPQKGIGEIHVLPQRRLFFSSAFCRPDFNIFFPFPLDVPSIAKTRNFFRENFREHSRILDCGIVAAKTSCPRCQVTQITGSK